jgi:hypothetical protein
VACTNSKKNEVESSHDGSCSITMNNSTGKSHIEPQEYVCRNKYRVLMQAFVFFPISEMRIKIRA